MALSTTAATSLLSNAAASGIVYRVVAIYAANVDGGAAADITVRIYSLAALGGTAFPIASTISVPADSTLVVVDKNAPIYLLENMSIGAQAAVANDIVMHIFWEAIS